MTGDTLPGILEDALGAHPDGTLCAGFSGGPDSTALLHALAGLPGARARGLRALHVDHGLHPESGRWAARCEDFCRDLGIPLQVCQVAVDTDGRGIEAAARDARYAALAEALSSGDILLTAHHRDDQAETVLLKLLRGAGPEGLGGMRACRPLGAGQLWRPLLDTPREVLAAYLATHGLAGIDDPSNRSHALARGFLRQEILPRLAPLWPEAARAISHGARLSREADDYIRQRACECLPALRDAPGHPLDAEGWLALHPALRGPAMDQWLYECRLPAPGLAHREQLARQIRQAAGDRVPLVQWPGAAVHVWRGQLHAHLPLPDPEPGWSAPWRGEPLALPGGGLLRLVSPSDIAHGTHPAFIVRLGQTGVSLRPAGDRHTRKLRDLYQRAGIPPWQRRLCPLIHARDGRLLAVADLWLTQAGHDLFDALDCRPQWHRGMLPASAPVASDGRLRYFSQP